jgi:F420H(2)-dependent quinone reductase
VPGDGLPDPIRTALTLDLDSSAWDRTVDITTFGRRSSQPRRIEIWFYRYGDKVYLSGLPGRRDWYANLLEDPRLVFHFKRRDLHADLPAAAKIITDTLVKREIFEHFVADMNQSHNPARIQQPTLVADWLAGSPLVEVIFNDSRIDVRRLSGDED